MMVRGFHEPMASRRWLRTCSQFNRSLTGAKCDWTPLGSPIFPTHSSRTLTFMLIWIARDLCEVSLHRPPDGFAFSYLHKYFLRVKIRLKVSPEEGARQHQRDTELWVELTCRPVHHLRPELGDEGRVDVGEGQESVKCC